jgi:hypothetical protein
MKRDTSILIESKRVTRVGRFLKIAKLADEVYVNIEDPPGFVEKLRSSGLNADIFTFCQAVHDRTPRYEYYREPYSLAVLPLTTYDNWLTHQIKFKPRNKIKKAQKCGVRTSLVEFSDDLVTRIRQVYDESAIRQGRRNLHYGKDFETLRLEHATFLERSEFIGAYYGGDLIGFAKVTHSENYSALMNIVAMISHRDKAPTNALIAKTVEICAQRNSPLLVYGIWSRRGMEDFKLASGFKRFEIPRYFVALNRKGELALRFALHRKIVEYIPDRLIDGVADLRARWNGFRYRKEAFTPRSIGKGAAS